MKQGAGGLNHETSSPGHFETVKPADQKGERTSQAKAGVQTPSANQIALARGLTQVIPFGVNIAAALKFPDFLSISIGGEPV